MRVVEHHRRGLKQGSAQVPITGGADRAHAPLEFDSLLCFGRAKDHRCRSGVRDFAVEAGNPRLKLPSQRLTRLS